MVLVSNLQLGRRMVSGFALLQIILVLEVGIHMITILMMNPFNTTTANPHHLPPISIPMIGHTDQANHQYDLSALWNAATIGNLPAVIFIKAPTYQDAHPMDSTPVDEQIDSISSKYYQSFAEPARLE